jgi:hypothetical protein
MTNIQLIKRLVIIFEVPTFVGEELCGYWISFPINRFNPMFFQIIIALTEMIISKETPHRRERRGVNRFQHKMLRSVDCFAFFLRICTPEKKHKITLLLIENIYHAICELFPSFFLMGACHMSPYS